MLYFFLPSSQMDSAKTFAKARQYKNQFNFNIVVNSIDTNCPVDRFYSRQAYFYDEQTYEMFQAFQFNGDNYIRSAYDTVICYEICSTVTCTRIAFLEQWKYNRYNYWLAHHQLQQCGQFGTWTNVRTDLS